MQPPKWADRFLRWYCNPDLLEEIQGDIYELFERRVDTLGESKANLKFIWDVLRFFRWSNIIRTNSKYKMNKFILFRSYLKLGFRSITRNWATSAINIFGLSVSIGLAVTIFIFVDMQLNMDGFHSKSHRIYQVNNFVQEENQEVLWGDSPLLLGPQLKEDYPAIEDFTRLEFAYGNVRYQDNVFNEFITFVDPSYFKIFDFSLMYGNRNVLENKQQIVISKEMAVKYFANIDPIGKEVSIKFQEGIVKRFSVGAVLDERPDNSSFFYNIYLPIDNFFDLNSDQHFGWDYLTDATFILLKAGIDPNSLQGYFPKYIDLQNASNPKWVIRSFEAMALTDLSVNNHKIVGSVSQGSHPAGRIALGIIAILLLVLASFNFMNIAVAAASKRLREIALRKVMGGHRKQIIHQFLTENLLQCIFSLILGTMLSYFLFLPGFNQMIPIHIPFAFSSFPLMVGFFLLLLLFIGVASSAYPSIYISRFHPISIFRGNEKFGSKNVFSKILLSFQFFFAFVTIVGSFVFTDNAKFLGEKDWGYNPDNVISVRVENKAQFSQLRDRIERNPDVISVAASNGSIANYDKYIKIDHLGKEMQAVVYHVDGQYMDGMNLRLKSGRFLTDVVQDQKFSAVVSEQFAEKMGWEEPVGKTFTYDSIKRTVIGVVDNFYYRSFYTEREAVCFVGLDEMEVNYATIKTTPDKLIDVDEVVKTSWTALAPNDPYERKFQEDVFDSFYQENDANIALMNVISGFTIILASLGLYGLLSFNIQRRLKEFSIRKVLGAAPSTILRIASKQYAWIIGISFALGAPIGFWLISQLVSNIYVEHKPANPVPFLISIGIVVFTVAITISGQILKATRVNPSQNLRNE